MLEEEPEPEPEPERRPFRFLSQIPPSLEKSLNNLYGRLEEQFRDMQETFEKDLTFLTEVRSRQLELEHQQLNADFDHNTKILHEFLNRDIPAPPSRSKSQTRPRSTSTGQKRR